MSLNRWATKNSTGAPPCRNWTYPKCHDTQRSIAIRQYSKSSLPPSFCHLARHINPRRKPEAEHCASGSIGAKCDLSAGVTGTEKRRNSHEARTHHDHHCPAADSLPFLPSGARAATADGNRTLCIRCRKRQPAGGQLHRLDSASVQHDPSAECGRTEGGDDYGDAFP